MSQNPLQPENLEKENLNPQNLSAAEAGTIPETLEEQRDYYLDLYQKWAKWQQESPEKLPEGFRNKAEFDFEEMIKNLKSLKIQHFGSNFTFFELANNDVELNEIILGTFIIKNQKFKYFSVKDVNFSKNIIFNNNDTKALLTLHLKSLFGALKIINKNIKNPSTIRFSHCNFSHITLENFDRGYFSPEANEYLNQMDSEGKLTLINCTWSGLPAVREEQSTTVNKIEKTFEFTKIIKSQDRSAFAQYLSGFVNFLEETQNKHISLDISLNGGLLFKVSSTNQSDLDNIEKYLLQYLAIPPLVARGRRPSIEIATGLNPNQAQTILIALESDVHNLETKMKLKNANLMQPDLMGDELERIFLGMKDKIIGLNIEIGQLNKTTELLIDQNLELEQNLKKLKEELRTIRLENINLGQDEKLDSLINLLGHLSLVLVDKKNPSLIKKTINEITDFLKLNESKIKLLPLGGQTFQKVQVIIEEFSRNF